MTTITLLMPPPTGYRSPRCACRGIELGSYDNAVTLPDPPDAFGFTRLPISVDACIAAEIQSLWELGIKTLASCCGHNRVPGVIAVPTEYDDRMRALGYSETGAGPSLTYWSPQYRRARVCR